MSDTNKCLSSTVVEVVCASLKQGFQWGQTAGTPEWIIELKILSDASSVFYKQSGGTNFSLKIINAGAAAMFTPGQTYVVNISPKEVAQ